MDMPNVEIDTIKNVERILGNIFTEEENEEVEEIFELSSPNDHLSTESTFGSSNNIMKPEVNGLNQIEEMYQKLFKDQVMVIPGNHDSKGNCQLPNDKSTQTEKKQNYSSMNNEELNDAYLLKSTRILTDDNDYQLIKGNFLKMLISYNGSRFMQRILLNSNQNIIENIFEEIQNKISFLMINPYANYFCQQFYSKLSYNSKIQLLLSIQPNIMDICKSPIGTYTLQAIIGQLISNDEKEIVIKGIEGKVVELCNDTQGVHVIEKIITCFEEHLVQTIYSSIITDFLNLSTKLNGIFVCKKMIHWANSKSTIQKLREVLIKNLNNLTMNQYGNYTIRIALDTWPKDICKPLIISLKNKLFKLSMKKYSSNVVEKCLEKSDETTLKHFINEIEPSLNTLTLIKNLYGNFVLQKAIKLSKGNNRIKLIDCINKILDKIPDKKQIKKWKRIIQKYSYLESCNLNTNQDTICHDDTQNRIRVPQQFDNSNNHHPLPYDNIAFPSLDNSQRPFTSQNSNFSFNYSNIYPPQPPDISSFSAPISKLIGTNYYIYNQQVNMNFISPNMIKNVPY